MELVVGMHGEDWMGGRVGMRKGGGERLTRMMR